MTGIPTYEMHIPRRYRNEAGIDNAENLLREAGLQVGDPSPDKSILTYSPDLSDCQCACPDDIYDMKVGLWEDPFRRLSSEIRTLRAQGKRIIGLDFQKTHHGLGLSEEGTNLFGKINAATVATKTV